MFGLASPTCSAVRRLCIAVANAAILLAAAGPAHAAPFLYVTQHDKKVSQYEIVAGGLLAPMDPPAVATDGEGMGVAVSPDGQSVYAVNYKGGSISQYDVGPGGALSPKSPAAVAAGQYPYTVTVSPDGHSVYANNQLLGLHMGPGQVWQYDVGPGGALSPKSPATVDAGDEPSDITVSPDSHSVYVPDMFDGYANFVVQQYDVGPGGALSPKSPATVATGEGANSVAVSPDGESVYVASNASSTGESGYVSQYDVGPGGALSPKGPAKVAAGSRAKSVTVSPDGQSVYVIDKYEGTISQYDVGAGGALSPGTKTSVVTPDELAAGDWPEDMAVSPALGPTAKKQCKRGGWDRFGFKRSGGCIRSVKRDALHSCRKARDLIGRRHFRHRYGNPKRHHRRAMRRCVQSEIGTR